MKYPLTTDLVKRLKIEQKPVEVDSKGKIIYEENPSKKEYFVFCSSQNSPKGFGVRVATGTGKRFFVV